MKLGSRIILSRTEIEIANFIAKLRTSANRKRNIKSDMISQRDTHDYIELQGISAEIAFCKLFNIYPDFTTHIRSARKGTDKADVKLGNLIIDIKTTKYKTGKLIDNVGKPIRSDYHALMVGESPEFVFKGFYPTNKLYNPDNIKVLTTVPTYVVSQDQLIDFEDLNISN